jgi:hypothetical protein
MSLVANAVSGGLRGYVLQDPEAGMNAAELGDRRNDHVWRVLRCACRALLNMQAAGLHVDPMSMREGT